MPASSRRRRHVAERDLRDRAGERGLGHAAAHHRGVGGAGRDGIDGDLVLGIGAGEAAGHRDDAALGGGIGDRAAEAADSASPAR